MKLGKIFICINIVVLSLLMLTGCISKGESWPRIVYQPSYWKFDNRIVDVEDGYILDDGHSYDIRIPYYDYDKITPEYMTELISSCSENKK